MLDRNALLFSPTREGVPSSDDNFIAADLLAAQEALEEEAREAIPFASTECTYDMGYIKQPLYACLTCLHNRAVCAGCSISCHAEHQLVELFNRRHFRCDCGTEAMGAGSCCQLTGREDAPANKDNRYDANFRGEFCFCGAPYDPQTESDTMYQCIVCEDWVHHGCVFGKHIDDDEQPPLKQDDFDQFVCERCVKGEKGVRKIMERWAGVEGSGVMLVSKENQVVGRAFLPPDDDEDDLPQGEAPQASTSGAAAEATEGDGSASEAKRKAEDEAEQPPAKKAKGGDEQTALPSLTASTSSSSIATITSASASISITPSLRPSSSAATTAASTASSSATSSPVKTCRAPPVLPPGESSLAKLEKEGARANVFLEEGWMLRWCRCSQCLPLFIDYSYMLDEEDVYEPPEDPDAHKSTFELGMDQLMRMPRQQAIDGLQAFNGLSDRLRSFLRPHADGGVTITKEVIDQFFEQEREAREALQRGG
ncbi:hypothetical protein JCM6882_006296 [Rhodosporidiobolus microsporus]